MAFIKENFLSELGWRHGTSTRTPRKASYITTDSIDTVSASGYFNRIVNKLAIGDEITVTVVDNVNPSLRTSLVAQTTLVVTLVAGSVVTTLNLTDPISDVTPITYLAPSGTLAIPLDDKLDEVVSVTGWMTTAYDAAADHTTWLQNVIEKVHTNFNGATVGILFPHALYNLSATLSIPYDHIHLIGRGAGEQRTSSASTRASAATRIAYTAASAVPLI